MKKTYKKIKSTAPTSDKKLSTSDGANSPSMLIKVSSTKEKKLNANTKEELTISFSISKENISELESNINKLKTDINIERNNTMKDSTELNKKLKELNNEINRLEINNKYLTNNINNKKKSLKNNKNISANKNSEKGNNIDKLNKILKLNQNMISNNKLNIKLLKKEKNFLEKEIKENDIPDQKENLEKQLEDILIH